MTPIRLAIGLILGKGYQASSEFWDAYERLMDRLRTGEANPALRATINAEIVSVRRITAPLFPIDAARNQVVAEVVKQDDTHLLFLDLDHVFKPDLAEQLLRHDKPVVTARYHMRSAPFNPVCYVKHPIHTGAHAYATVHFGQGLIEIERGGCGALMIRRDVLTDIEARVGHNWFRYQRSPDPPHDFTVSEDFWFYRQAREAGHRCYCDWDTEVGHLQLMVVGRVDNLAYLNGQIEGLGDLTPEARATTVQSIIVCGYPNGMALPDGTVIESYQVTEGER